MLVLVYGISGRVGHAVSRAALRAGHKVRGISRTPDKLDKDVFEHLEGFVKMNDIYDIPALDKAVRGVDAIVSAAYYSPQAVLDGQILLLRAAERAGVKIFHSASWNYDWSKLGLGVCESYDSMIAFANHARISSPIKPLHAFTGIIPDYLLLHSPHSNPIDKTNKTFTYLSSPDEEQIHTTLKDLGEFTVQAIADPNAAEGGYYYVESFRCTPAEIVKTYEETHGVKLQLKKVGSYEDVKRMLTDVRARFPAYKYLDVPEYTALAYANIMYLGTCLFESIDSNGRWSHVQTTTLREWFEQHPEA